MRPLTYGSGPSEKPYLPRPQQAPVGIARWHFRLLRKPKLFSAALHNSAKNIYRRNPGKKKNNKKKTQFQDRCLAVSGSLDHTCHLISLSPSFTLLFSLSLSLYVAFGSGQRNRMATVPSLADNFALFPSQRVTRHSLLGSESNHTSLTNRRPCSG